MDTTVSAHTFFDGPASKTPISTIIAWGVRAPANIGSIARLAANFACDRVFFVDEQEVAHNQRLIRKTSVNAASHVDWSFVRPAEIVSQHPATQPIIGLETSRESTDLRQMQWPQGCALMIGGERYGLPDEALALCQSTVHIQVCGPLKSLNVSHALGIALFVASLTGSPAGGRAA